MKKLGGFSSVAKAAGSQVQILLHPRHRKDLAQYLFCSGCAATIRRSAGWTVLAGRWYGYHGTIPSETHQNVRTDRVRNPWVLSTTLKGSFYGGLVETGKHTALKMRSRKASGFESLALYQNRDIPVKTCRCGGIGRRRRVMRFDSDAAYPNLLGLSSYP